MYFETTTRNSLIKVGQRSEDNTKKGCNDDRYNNDIDQNKDTDEEPTPILT